MEGTCVAVECASSCPPARSAQGAVALLHPGIDALAKILGDVVLQSDADHRRGGASAAVAAGLFQETDADIGLSPETRIISVQDPFHGQGVVPHPPRENEDLRQRFVMQDPAMVVKIQIFIVMFFLFRLCFLSLRQPKVGLVTCCVIAIW